MLAISLCRSVEPRPHCDPGATLLRSWTSGWGLVDAAVARAREGRAAKSITRSIDDSDCIAFTRPTTTPTRS